MLRAVIFYYRIFSLCVMWIVFFERNLIWFTKQLILFLFENTSINLYSLNLVAGLKCFPLGAQRPLRPLKPLSRPRTDEHRTSLRGSGTGNAVTRGNLFQKNKFWFNENEILFSGKKKGRFYSFFLSPFLLFFFSIFSFTLPLIIASQKCIKFARNDALQSVLSCHFSGVQKL